LTSLVIMAYISAMLYLDYAASTPLCNEALEALEHSLKADFANPSAAHKLGKDLSKKIEETRQLFLKSLGATREDQFIFTSSATESNNLLIAGLSGQGKIFYSEADHPSQVVPVKQLEGRELCSIPLHKNGSIDVDSFLDKIDPSTSLVLLSQVNNHSGNLHSISDLSQKIKEINPKTHIHVDGVQGYSKIPLDISKTAIDSYSLSSHKIEGPKGIAGLFLKKGISLTPLFFGGGQENGLRSSTQAAPLIFSFAAAAEKNCKLLDESYSKVEILNQSLRRAVASKLDTVIFPFPGDQTSPYILTLLVPGISSDIILRHLEQKNIFLSSSSACSSKVKGINPVFSALGIDQQYHKNVLRISLSDSVSQQDLDYFVEEFSEVLDELKPYMRQ
jgi:cysteine desulfurase